MTLGSSVPPSLDPSSLQTPPRSTWLGGASLFLGRAASEDGPASQRLRGRRTSLSGATDSVTNRQRPDMRRSARPVSADRRPRLPPPWQARCGSAPLLRGRSGWRTVGRSLVAVAGQDDAEAETAEILAETTLMAAIREGLAESKAGRTSTH